MARLVMFLLMLAFVSAGLGFLCQSTTAAGVAVFLCAGFTGLCATVLAMGSGHPRSTS